MERLFTISPAIVALLIFAYMRACQAKRNDKLRRRFWRAEDNLIDRLKAGNNSAEQSASRQET